MIPVFREGTQRALENQLGVFGVKVRGAGAGVFGDGGDVKFDFGVRARVGWAVVDLERRAIERDRLEAIEGSGDHGRVGAIGQCIRIRHLDHKGSVSRRFAGISFAIEGHGNIGISGGFTRNSGCFVGGDVVFGPGVVFGHQAGRRDRRLLRIGVDVDQLAVHIGRLGRGITDQSARTIDDGCIQCVLAICQFCSCSVPRPGPHTSSQNRLDVDHVNFDILLILQ